MAVTQLSDLVVPEFYAEYGGFDSMTSTTLYASGILENNPLLNIQVTGSGEIAFLPVWGDLAAANDVGGTEPNIGSDDPTVSAATKKISAVKMQVRKSMLNDAWSAADLQQNWPAPILCAESLSVFRRTGYGNMSTG